MSQDAILQNELANELLELAIKTAKKAGELLISRPDDLDINVKSSARDFATHMDHASEALIVGELLKARPNDGMIGEESTQREGTSGVTWVIDPIDGTVNYFYDLPGWNISIAAKDRQGALIGVVYAPTLGATTGGSLWHAIRGGGAFKNGREIHVNEPVSLGSALLGTGFSYDTERRQLQAAKTADLIPRVRDIRRFGAAAVDLCNVASGATDGYFEIDLHEWDLAAGSLIAREAGAIVSGKRADEEPSQKMTIAAGPTLHAALVLELADFPTS